MTDKPVSAHFPPEIREALRRASQILEDRPRQLAIERAIERARIKYPELFRSEPCAS